MTSVPEDIVRDIILKLPATTLLRFKCLSKSWHSLISSPDFIKLNLRLSLQSNHHKKFAVYDFTESDYMTFDAPYNFSDIIFGESTSITPPLKPIKYQYPFLDKDDLILCSCDGLLLVRTCNIAGPRNFILWNPSTRDSRELPTCGCPFMSNYALGYDSSTDDYKVIQHEYRDHSLLLFNIFSLRSNSWRKTKSDKLRLRDWIYINLNGALHWLQPNEERKIACFTLAEETFIEMDLPDDFEETFNVNLCVLQGCLCLSRIGYKATSLNVWLMKEYGVKASWTKFITIPNLPIHYPSTTYPPTPFCSMNKAVFIIHQIYRNSAMVIYDLEKKDFHVIEIINGQKEFHLRTQLTLVESLVSPN